MSAPAPEVTPEPAATAPVEATPAPEATPKPTETVEFWKAQARTNEQRAKDNAAAAQELQKIKDRDLTALQLAEKERDEAKSRAELLERTSLQQQVALDKGIPAGLVPALTGATADEMSAVADQLLAWRGNPPAPAPVPLRPDPSQGPRPPESDQAVADVQYANAMAQLKPSRR
jgi:hypothetical protein